MGTETLVGLYDFVCISVTLYMSLPKEHTLGLVRRSPPMENLSPPVHGGQARIKVGVGPRHRTTIGPLTLACVTCRLYAMLNCISLVTEIVYALFLV